MSYREESQRLEDPAREICDGIEKFNEAAVKRVEDGNWTTAHLARITELSQRLHTIRFELLELANDTW